MPDVLSVHSIFRTYRVQFVEDFAEPLRQLLRDRAVLVCDALVHDLYGTQLAGIAPEGRLLVIEALETNKTLEKCQEVITHLVRMRFRRDHTLVALGGGIIQDIAGFVATVLYRGVPWAFFPTTLLAQADSCVGSKSSINLGETKNVLGSFYPPGVVHIDVRFLDTLSVDDVKSGIGEIMHFYLYADSPKRRSLAEKYDLLLRERARLRDHIAESLRIKIGVVERDEFDRSERHKFNYGHTFGHALESVTGYAIKHGQAVTVGMDLANYLSVRFGVLNHPVFEAMHDWLVVNFPIYDWTSLDLERYVSFLAADKKNFGDDLTCILAAGPGKLVVRRIPLDEALREAIGAYFRTVAAPAVPGGR